MQSKQFLNPSSNSINNWSFPFHPVKYIKARFLVLHVFKNDEATVDSLLVELVSRVLSYHICFCIDIIYSVHFELGI